MGLEEKLPSALLPITVEKMGGELAGQGAPAAAVAAATAASESRSLGCSAPRNLAETQAILKPMPLGAWMAVRTAPLTPYPIDDPGLAAS